MIKGVVFLLAFSLLIDKGVGDPAIGGAPPQDLHQQAAPPAQNQQQVPPPMPQAQQQQVQQPPQQQQRELSRLARRVECLADVENHCKKSISQLNQGEVLSDMAALDCLQEAGYSEDKTLQPMCAQAIWEYKIEMTQDSRFITAIQQFCTEEMNKNDGIRRCTVEARPGYALSCMMEHVHEVEQNSKCFQFLLRSERIAFSDFRLVAPFVENCGYIIQELGCGTLTKPSAHQKVRVPHSQGATLECLISNMVNPPREPAKMKLVQEITKECRHEVMRIAELQSDDFHLDRPLYFSCRMDREQFCSDIPAGDGKVFQCLMEHKENSKMHPECSKILSERAGLMGQDYRLAHPLTKACGNEMNAYRCIPQPGFERSLHFHLSWVLLCLENGMHHYQQMLHDKEKDPNKKIEPQLAPFSNECQREMLGHREMMVQEFRMSPELVMSCAQEIDKLCSLKGDLENEGKTVHCLMSHAQERDEKKGISSQCKNALQSLVKVADIGSNYKVDKVLYASCRPLIEGKCMMDAQSEANTLTCLMRNIDGPDMTDECEQRLVEVQYFMARDWALDPQLYNACHKEAVERCSALDNWHMNEREGEKDFRVDPGPQVLACLYRAGYDEQKPLTPECAQNVHRVLRTRAVRVNLLPDIEENCREALSEYCSTNVQPQEEMNCLQEQFEKKQFKDKYPKCQQEITKFTQMESKDTKLNRLLTRACRPVIDTYCNQFLTEEIDHGDVMQCLSTHKDAQEMTPKCRSYVHHFELVSLRDYHFSYRFQETCQQDIQSNCAAYGQDKGAIIRCLSNIMFEHRVLGENKDLQKECKKQLRVAYLQQEQVNFDDKSHMQDADPELMRKCDSDLRRLNCLQKNTFEDVVECLRVDFDQLQPDCKAMVFGREKIEAMDNTFDDELQKGCKYDIGKFCSNQQGERVLDCLMNSKIVRLLQKGCQRIVQERMMERVKDDRLNPGLLMACKKDAEQYCPDDYKKINDVKYEKQQLGAIVASCLRGKFSQFSGGIHLSPDCKEEVSKVIIEAEFDIKLDPELFKACKTTINRHCSNTIISKNGSFDTVLECLKTDFYGGQIRDSNCAKQLARRTQESLVDIHLDPALYEACSVDLQRVCRDVPPGQSRVIMCLMDALNVPQITISQACRTKLTNRQKLWNIAHDEYKMALPESWSELVNVISNHPHRSSILTWLGGILLVLLVLGCLCGRWTKRLHSELKNR